MRRFVKTVFLCLAAVGVCGSSGCATNVEQSGDPTAAVQTAGQSDTAGRGSAAARSPAPLAPGAPRAAGARHNVLVIIADDLGTDKVGVYDEGDDATRPQTPTIDRLAAEGVRFVNAYSNTVCSPTRATIASGRYSFRYGIGTVISDPSDEFGLPLEEITIPEFLDKGGSGYDHAQLGKWHLGVHRLGGPANPLWHGFNWTAGPASNIADYYRWTKQVNGEERRVRRYATRDTTDDAIERANAMPQPWFIWLAYNAPHAPLHYPPQGMYRTPVATIVADAEVNMYATMVEALDSELQRLLDTMRPEVLAATDIILMGDNGTPADVVRGLDGAHAKGTLFEGGINVPLIVSGPVVPPEHRGKVSESLVNLVDVYATVAEIAGVDLAQVLPPGHALDSRSLMPALRDPENGVVREFAFSEEFIPNGPPPWRVDNRMVRDARWKLIRKLNRERIPPLVDLFFDMDDAEPGTDGKDLCPCPENLSDEAREAYERLLALMEAIRSS